MFQSDLPLSQSASKYKTKTIRAVLSQVLEIFGLDFCVTTQCNTGKISSLAAFQD